MAGATLEQIREQLVVNLSTLTSIGDAKPYLLGNEVPPVVGVVGPDMTEYDLAMARGLDRWLIVVRALAGSPLDLAKHKRLDGWLAPSGGESIKTAIETDKTLGGLVQNARVVSSTGYREYTLGNGIKVLGCDFTVEIFNTGMSRNSSTALCH